MAPPRKRLVVPPALVVALISAGPLAGCSPHSPVPDDVAGDTANDSETLTDASDVTAPLSDACMLTQCVGGPINLCADDDGGVLGCPGGACTAAYTRDGGYIGRQCYGECVTSTLADGATQSGFC